MKYRNLGIIVCCLLSGILNTQVLYANEITKVIRLIAKKQEIHAAEILFPLQFGKDSCNPVLYHCAAQLSEVFKKMEAFPMKPISSPTKPIKPEKALKNALIWMLYTAPDAEYENAFLAMKYWSLGNEKEWTEFQIKYALNYNKSDTLLYNFTQKWWTAQPNFNLDKAKILLAKIEKNQLQLTAYETGINTINEGIRIHLLRKSNPEKNPEIFLSLSLRAHFKLIEFQKEYIERLEFDSLLHGRNIAALKTRHKQLLAAKKPNDQIKRMIQSASDTLLQWEFEEALSEDNEASYRRFLKSYPKAPQKNAILQKIEAMAFEQAQQANTIDAYEKFLESQLPPPLGRPDLSFRAKFLLHSLTVNPIPIRKANAQFFYADSVCLEPWLDQHYQIAYPFALHNDKNIFVENGSTLIPGCALVMRMDTFGLIEFGYITKDGQPFTKNSYETIYQFSSKMAFVQRGGRWGILKSNGKELLPCKFENLRYDVLHHIGALKTGKKWALFNESGKLTTLPKYDAIGFETWENEPTESPSRLWIRNRCAVQMNGSWALIDTLGNALTPFAYESMTSLPYGRFMGKINNGYCLWRDTIHCSAEYSETVDFGKPYTLVQQKGWGIIDTLGKILVPPIYEKALLVGSTVALLKNKKWNYYYSKGEFSLPIKGTIDEFRIQGDGMVFARQKKTWILYHAFTKTVRRVKSLELQQLTDTLLLEPIGSSWFITHANSKVLLHDTLVGLSRLNDHEWLASKLNGMGLLCLPSMQWSLKPLYQEIILAQHPSQYMVKKNDKWGVVNNFGDIIVPLQYDAITDTEFPGYWYALSGEQTLWIDASGRALIEN
ncbi:MAG: hypothetical protein CK532_06590 [Flavobacteriales bacterium]|nr:WG repeat-containing protein [Flavobacteriaceae bacterium]PHX91757.1 MAG: hypothetical protein CK532_06590 [Flavobacteriales bacterium]